MADMLPELRRSQIVDEVERRGQLRVNELSDLLGVAPVTIRRDIQQLSNEGLLRRVHGGAAATSALRTPAALVADTRPPSPAAEVVGMLVPSLDYVWPEVVLGVQETVLGHNLRLQLRGTAYGAFDDRDHMEFLLKHGHAAGLIIAPNLEAPDIADTLAWLQSTGVPFVLVEREASIPPYDEPCEGVVTDHAYGAALAVRHLAELGHRRVGLVINNSPQVPKVRQGWLKGSTSCSLDTAGVPERLLDRPHPLEDDPEVDEIIDACLSTRTSALLVHSDREAIAILQRCRARGVDVPGQLSLVSYDDELAALSKPSLTAVRPPRTSIGRTAVDLLAGRLADPARPRQRVLLTPRLNIRDSTAAPDR